MRFWHLRLNHAAAGGMKDQFGSVTNPGTVYRSLNAAHINPWSRRRLLLPALPRPLPHASSVWLPVEQVIERRIAARDKTCIGTHHKKCGDIMLFRIVPTRVETEDQQKRR